MCVWKFHNESYHFAQLITRNHKSKIILAVIEAIMAEKSIRGEREFTETSALLGAGSNHAVKDDSIANVEVEESLGFR